MRKDIKQIKKGDLFVEKDGPFIAKLVALEDARVDDALKQTHVRVKAIGGDQPGAADENGEFELMEAFDCGAYGLRLYDVEDYDV